MKKRKGMSMLLVLTIVLLLSSCAADAGAESQVESVGSSADPMDENVAAATALLEEAVERAKSYLSGALAAMLDLGKGSGPMNHAFDIRSSYGEGPER